LVTLENIIGKPNTKTSDNVLSFDWRDNPDVVIDSFSDALREYGIQVFSIDTKSGYFAVVVCDSVATKEDAIAVYESWLRNK